ncbi:MAG: DUF3179 domain-containing protein [Bacteroidota bacterium]
MKKINPMLVVLALLFVTTQSCNKEGSSTWLINESEVRDGGPGKDGIPSIDNPVFVDPGAADFLVDNEIVIGIRIGNEMRAYPHQILDWHEIVNDAIGSDAFAVTYCPLTGTAIGWDREVDGSTTTFGVSGLLYNSNLIPYDRKTDSNWSQMRLDCVNGELSGTEINTYHLVEMDWGTWKRRYPEGKVLSTDTGFNRNYGSYPYGSYRNDNNLFFGVNNEDNRLGRKERVLGVLINGKAKTYRFEEFSAENIVVKTDNFEGAGYVLAGSDSENFMVAYSNVLDGTALEFSAVQNDDTVIMMDNEGNEWDLFGVAVNGPRQGQRLEPMLAYVGYWFAWAAFYPGLELYE